MEIWKRLIYDGVDLGDFYEISNLGNVRNAKRKKLLKTRKTSKGYLQCAVTLGGKKNFKTFKVHKAVAETFVPKDKGNNKLVTHINGNREDNRVENLKWVSQSELTTKAHSEGKMKPGVSQRKPVYQIDAYTNEIVARHESISEAARKLGNIQYNQHICDVCQRKRDIAYGFRWEYDTQKEA